MTLGKAIKIASQWHEQQIDKGGNPYILHPLHVMRLVQENHNDPDLAIIAVLHDIVEDTPVTLEYLEAEGFSPRVIDAVDHLTKRYGQSREDYINRLVNNEDAIHVKIEDIIHNSDIRRLKGLTKRDFKRMEHYQKTYEFLKNKLNKK